MGKRKYSRRSVLKTSLSSSLAIPKSSAVVSSILTSIATSSMAQGQNQFNKKLITMFQAGAPPRWMFDLALTPDGDTSKLLRSRWIGSRYEQSGGRYTGTVYATTLQNGLHMPWIWSTNIPTSNGGVAPMSNLMDGMLSIRGVDTGNSGHFPSRALHFLPIGTSKSIAALTAEKSSAPISSVNLGVDSHSLKSPKNLSATTIKNLDNGLVELMSSFREIQNNSYQNEKSKVSSLLDSALNMLNGQSETLNPSTIALKQNMTNAIELFNRDFGDLESVFGQLFLKYKNLIDRSINPSHIIPGVTDLPIGTTGSRSDSIYRSTSSGQMTKDDIRDIYVPAVNGDKMARGFAITEFIILNNLSSSVSFLAHHLERLSGFNNSYDFDEHYVGAMSSIFINARYNTALAACMYEFISQLKANNMYQDCVIDLAGEFGRIPMIQNGSWETEHAGGANMINLFSGAIQGSHVIGNITAVSGSRMNQNLTCGYGGDNGPEFGKLGLGHFAHTLSHILGVQSPVTSAKTLVRQEGTKFVPLLPTGTIVDA